MVNKTVKIDTAIYTKLTASELSEAGKDAAATQDEIEKELTSFKEIYSAHKKKITALNEKVASLLAAIHSGKDVKTRPCIEEYCYDEGKLKTWYAGELMYERALTDDEKQVKMPIVEEPKPQPKLSVPEKQSMNGNSHPKIKPSPVTKAGYALEEVIDPEAIQDDDESIF